MKHLRNLIIFLSVLGMTTVSAVPVEAQESDQASAITETESREAPPASVTRENVPGPWIPVDFREWNVEGEPSAWTFSADGRTLSNGSNQNGLAYVTYPGSVAAVEIRGTMSVQSTADDDMIGGTFGLTQPQTANGDPVRSASSVTWVWKQSTSGAPEGFTLSRFEDAPLIPGDIVPLYWEDGEGVELLDSDLSAGTGWTNFTRYDYRARYTPTEIEIWIDDVLVLSAEGVFPAGMFGPATISQVGATFENFEYRFLNDVTVEVDAGVDQEVLEGATVQLGAVPDIDVGPESLDLIVSAQANLWGAGLQELPIQAGGVETEGVLPVQVDGLEFGAGVPVTVSASGIIVETPGGIGHTADGLSVQCTVSAFGNIAGLSTAGTLARGVFLGGVFLDMDGDVDQIPAGLTMADSAFTTLSPQLNQPFFIGDGVSTEGIVQEFFPPPGATRLFLGIVDAADCNGIPTKYDDNSGELEVTVSGAAKPASAARSAEEIFRFDSFEDLSGLQINGIANQLGNPVATANGDALRLVSANPHPSVSSAYWSESIDLTEVSDWSSQFTFRLSETGQSGADGVAFVIAPSPTTLTSNGGNLGYVGTDTVAVELDSYQNNWDESENHLGISIGGDVGSIIEIPLDADIENEALWTAWLEYEGSTNSLSVWASDRDRPIEPLVTQEIDLPAVVGTSDVYFGIHGSNGGAAWQTADLHAFELYSCIPVGTCPQTISYEWDLISSTGPAVQLSSPNVANPTFDAVDDGVYTFRVSATVDGLTASDTVTVTVGNQDPVVAVEGSAAPTDGAVFVTGSLTDPGFRDTHQVEVDWGDGSTPSSTDIPVQGAGWGTFALAHTYETAGAFNALVTVSDDDGGSVTSTIAITVLVGGVVRPSPGIATWADSTDGSGLRIAGRDIAMDGRTHSNAGIEVNDDTVAIGGDVSLVGTLTETGRNHSIDPTAQTGELNPPVDLNLADYQPGGRAALAAASAYTDLSTACTGAAGDSVVLGSSDLTGLVWAPCALEISGEPAAAVSVTVVSDASVRISNRGHSLGDPFIDDLSILAGGSSLDPETPAVRISGDSHSAAGLVAAPNGLLRVSGLEHAFTCGLLGGDVLITGMGHQVTQASCPESTVGLPDSTPVTGPGLSVPTITTEVAASVDTVVPGESVSFTGSVANEGAIIAVPGLVQVVNTANASLTIADAVATLESQDAVSGVWSAVASTPATGIVDPAAGVTTDGAFVGTEIAPNGSVTAALSVGFSLTDAQLSELLDPAAVGGLRMTVVLQTSGPFSQTLRLDPDLLDTVRASAAIDPQVDASLNGTTVEPVELVDPALAPGASLTETIVEIAPSAEKLDGETNEAFATRLEALDGSLISSSLSGTATSAVGSFPIALAFDSATVSLPVLRAELEVPASARQGDDVPLSLTVTNTGSAPADLSAALSESVNGPLVLTGLPAVLAPGEQATGTAIVSIAADQAANVDVFAQISWPVGLTAVALEPIGSAIRVLQPAALVVTQVADTFNTPPGEVFQRIIVRNSGDDPVTGVVVVDRPSTGAGPVVGTLTTSAGTATEEVDGITVDIGTIAANDSVIVEYRIDFTSVSAGEVVTQSTVSSNELADVVSDDPNVDGVDDPTVFIVNGGNGGGGSTTVGWFGDPNLEGGIFTPADGSIVTAPTDVTVDPSKIQVPDGRAIASWELVAVPAGDIGTETSSNGVVVSSGTGAVPTDLGSFDPTVLENGIWRLELQMIDDTGQTGIVWTDVTVEGNLKLGRFALTYEDMNVNVGSIPIQVLRSYDTLDRNTSDDFGFGWNLDVADFDVRTNGPLGFAGWEQYSCGGGFLFVQLCYRATRPHYVTVTWPNGQVESFDFTPEGTSSFLPGAVIPKFTARDSRTTSTLGVLGADDTGYYNSATGLINQGLFGEGGLYDPQRFTLTDRFGTIYLLSVDDGLISATDRNGNSVTVTDDGIISSQGPAITFERDTEGRITSATGPDGEAVVYTYDAAGDLTTTTDQNGEVYGFTYDQSHYLTGIDDPGAGPQQVLTYSDDGRLESVTDAEGNTTQISVDPDARTEIVTSPDGNLVTVSQFDERGNATTVDEVYDGASHVSTFVFDDQDQVTSRTDPEGNAWVGVYDDDRNLTSFTDAESNASGFTYDDFGFPTSVTDAETNTTEFAYDGSGNLITITDARGGVQEFTYDNRGNQLTRTDQIDRIWNWTYTGADRVATATDPRGNTTTYSYDAQGRVSRITAADGGATNYGYDDVGNLTRVTDPLGRVTNYAYDERDRLTLQTDAAGFSTAYAYDDNDRLVSRTDPTSRTWTYAYDFDRLTSETAPDGGVTGYTYDGAGRVETMTDPLGRTTSYGYDGANRRTTVTSPIDDGGTAVTSTSFDGNGRSLTVTNAESETTSYSYDGLGRLVTRTDGLGRATSYTFDEVGNRTTVTNANSETTTSAFDLANQLLSVTNALNEATTYAYDPAGNLASVTDPLARTTGYSYDEVNRQIGTTLPSGDASSTVFDTAGQVLTSTSAAGYATTFTYDPRGLVATVADALGNTTTNAYDEAGRRAAVTDARNNTTTFAYDPVGRLESETDPLGGSVVFGYDLAGQRISVTDPNAATRTFGYDDGGRMTTATDALSRATSYAYDAVGRRTSMTDPRGITVVSVFDAAGQLTGQTSPNEVRSFTYDPVGRMTEWTDITGTTTQDFDGVGRLVEVAAPAGTVGYGFNVAGERTSMTQPEGTVAYTYDANGFQASVTDWRNDTITVANDPDGRVVSLSRSNGVDSVHSFDAAGRLTDIGHTGPAGLIDSFGYTLDGNGNRTQVTSSAGVESYTIDELNRLTGVSYPDASGEVFGYDATSNRTSHTRTDGTTVGYTVDAAGQLVTDTDGVTYSYDDTGNLTGTSAGDVYGWDDYGRLSTATVAGTAQTYVYDAAGVRTGVDGVGQVWDRAGLPTLVSAATDSYVHTAVGVTRTGDDWALTDAVGSVRATTDTAGVVGGQTAYTAFGEPIVPTPGFGFAGEQQDLTGLQHLRARQYNPALGRFLSVDPIQPGAPGTVGWGLYGYAGSNPTTATDPSGRLAVIESGTLNRNAKKAAPGLSRLGQGTRKALVLAGAYVAAECLQEGYTALLFDGDEVLGLPGPCGLLDPGKKEDPPPIPPEVCVPVHPDDCSDDEDEESTMRFQVQGRSTSRDTRDVEASVVARAGREGVTVVVAQTSLETLVASVTPASVRKAALPALNQALSWVKKRPPLGIPSGQSKSFNFRLRGYSQLRVDVESLRGKNLRS